MSILDTKLEYDKNGNVTNGEVSQWIPTEDEAKAMAEVRFRFALGYNTMYTPRVEFNDLSVIGRDQTDFLAFNTYQPNNGDGFPGDQVNGWHSNAIRPIERNKAISIAAHATSKLLFPKIFAFNQESQPEQDAAEVMESLMEFVGDKYNYAWSALQAVIQALVSPASIMHKEYIETYRTVKRDRGEDGKWVEEKVLDEDLSGFRDTIVPTDQFFIENFFEPDVQKQRWLIWRRVQSFDIMKAKYGHLPNFQYVRQGMQILYNDANQGFYWVYDPNMRQYMCEEVMYYEKERDLYLIFVNGVIMTSPDNPNPRWDKLYPFVKFGYEFIRPANCFYYKSLIFRVSHDANIINTLYPLIIDGSYLNVMPPFVTTGSEVIASDVIVPGRVTNLSSPGAKLEAVKIANDLASGIEAMFKVEESINQSSEIPVSPENRSNATAYEIQQREEERNAQLGLFVQMIASFVQQYGRIQLGDILQHMTVADADKITQAPDLVYKTFVMKNRKSDNTKSFRKVKFTQDILGGELEESYKTLKEEGGTKTDIELYRVNPEKVRDLQYMLVVSADVLSPRSEAIERMYNLEAYDRAIQNPTLDQKAVTREFLLSSYDKTKKDPDKFFAQGAQMPGAAQPPAAMPAVGNAIPQPNQPQPVR